MRPSFTAKIARVVVIRECELKFARTETGYRLRVQGCGTSQQSAAAEMFVDEALCDPAHSVVIDLSSTSYLDSTFLGCLLGMYRRHGAARLRIAAPKDVARNLFGPTKLDVALRVTDQLPHTLGEDVTIKLKSATPTEIARHIMECHRRLGETPGPQQQVFAAIARQLARELEQRS